MITLETTTRLIPEEFKKTFCVDLSGVENSI